MKKDLYIKIYFFVFWLFLVISFLVLAFFVLSEATGYSFNLKTFHLEMTGLISLDGTPKNVEINVNGKIQVNGLPLKLSKIFPGQYEITISGENYSTWSKLYNVAGGQAYEEKKVYLFYTKPVISETKAFSIQQIIDFHKNQSNKVVAINNEIWYQDELISRFAGIVHSAILTNDRKHIIFHLNKELRVVELDGKNNTKLFDLPTDEKVIYALVGDNKIAYIDQEKIFEVQIR